ncbi:30S ribosomal protein S27 [Syntrophorhabdus aromaticivorans]|uniref:30S ribosomal protein S27 n=1 Tax=Syntrophorhabdus aromaticivorans TaxID=328301 RepID=UPI0003F8A15F|nr:30S ribosomal protein S27 [Syntrophorhabdus aromaticivorans]
MFHIIAALSTVFHLARTCPRCGRRQIVPRSASGKTVKCKFCGADVPPKSKGR